MNGLVCERAWAMHRQTGLDIQDLMNEGHSLALQAIESYDPTKGALLTSWVWRWVSLGLLKYAEGMNDKPPKEEFNPDLLPSGRTEWRPDLVAEWKSLLLSMSEEARVVVRILLHAPGEVLGTGRETPRQVRAKLRAWLLGRGWTHAKVWSTFREIKEVLE